MPRLNPARCGRALACVVPGLALAHGDAHSASLDWTFDAWVTVPLLVSAVLYGAGWRTLMARGTRPRAHRTSARWFCAGWVVLAAALVTPLHAAGERSFAAHMLEHELLMLVAAPLLVLSRPIGVALWSLPRAARHALARLGHTRAIRDTWRISTRPWFATFLQAAVLWGWHAPAAFDLALERPGWHVVQHLCFLGSALLFWWSVLQGRGRHRAGVATACLFFTSIVTGALGALMAISSGPWYAGYAAMDLPAFGLDPAQDQQLAGLLMWVPGGLVHAAVGIAMLARVLRPVGDRVTGLPATGILPRRRSGTA